MDLVQHSGCCSCASRSASGPQVNRTPPLYRTRACPRAERALVAGPSNSDLETYRRWLPSQPRDPESDRRCWFPIWPIRGRLHARPKTFGFHVRRHRSAAV